MRITVLCSSVLLLAAQTCLSQTTLQKYLNLTPQQSTTLQQLQTAYESYAQKEQVRINQLNQEIQSIFSTPSPDPNQLGPRYLELETIRRDMLARIATVQQQSMAQLTAAQLALIAPLDTAMDLQPLVNDGQCALLLDTLQYYPGNTLPLAYTFYSPKGFSDPAAYIPPAPSASFCNSNTFPISVRQYLNLTDTQVAAIYAVSATYNEQYLRAQNQIADVQVQIRDLTAAPSPDPVAIGADYAQLVGIQQQIQTYGAQARTAARATLTPAQTTQLQVLQNSVTLQPLVSQAEACSLLVPVPSVGTADLILEYGVCVSP